MHTHDVLGVATSGFTCGSSGVCVGTQYATQQLFYELQRQLNRVGPQFGVTRVAVDGKLGPATLRAATQIALNLSQRLGTNLDRSLEDLLIGIGEAGAATTRDLAAGAGDIVAALKRDGAAEKPWSVMAAITDTLTEIVNNGAAVAAQIPNNGQVINPYSTTTVTPPAPTTPAEWATAVVGPTVTPPTSPPAPSPAAYTAVDWQPPSVPMWIFAAGAGVVAVLGGVAAAIVSSRRRVGVAGARHRR